jgi:hypothetical protein
VLNECTGEKIRVAHFEVKMIELSITWDGQVLRRLIEDRVSRVNELKYL